MSGALVISLDFELHWGFFDRAKDDISTDIRIHGARTAVQSLLRVFSERNIRATWATVGLLLVPNASMRTELLPHEAQRPHYQRREFDPYSVAVGTAETDDTWHYAQSLVKSILTTDGQELASHTFGHYYCLEDGQTAETFEADLSAYARTAELYSINPVSIVLPRNQYNPTYEELLVSHGYRAYRGNPAHSWYAADSEAGFNKRLRKAMRFMDSMINLSGHHGYSWDQLKSNENSLLNIPSSRFLRPFSRRLGLLNKAVESRVCSDLRYCARQGSIYHLWWHPHNFSIELEENISRLENILDCYGEMNENFGMKSLNMGDIVRKVQNQ